MTGDHGQNKVSLKGSPPIENCSIHSHKTVNAYRVCFWCVLGAKLVL